MSHHSDELVRETAGAGEGRRDMNDVPVAAQDGALRLVVMLEGLWYHIKMTKEMNTSRKHAAPAEQPGKNQIAVESGRRGGKIGGKVRAEKLTPERRREIARIAAEARWKGWNEKF